MNRYSADINLSNFQTLIDFV